MSEMVKCLKYNMICSPGEKCPLMHDFWITVDYATRTLYGSSKSTMHTSTFAKGYSQPFTIEAAVCIVCTDQYCHQNYIERCSAFFLLFCRQAHSKLSGLALKHWMHLRSCTTNCSPGLEKVEQESFTRFPIIFHIKLQSSSLLLWNY